MSINNILHCPDENETASSKLPEMGISILQKY